MRFSSLYLMCCVFVFRAAFPSKTVFSARSLQHTLSHNHAHKHAHVFTIMCIAARMCVHVHACLCTCDCTCVHIRVSLIEHTSVCLLLSAPFCVCSTKLLGLLEVNPFIFSTGCCGYCTITMGCSQVIDNPSSRTTRKGVRNMSSTTGV